MVLSVRFNSCGQAFRRRPFTAAQRSAYRRTWQPVFHRGYSSTGDHAAKKAGGDLPWAIGSIVITVPSAWYLLQQTPVKSHGHAHEDEHEQHAEREEQTNEGESVGEPEDGAEVGSEDSTEANIQDENDEMNKSKNDESEESNGSDTEEANQRDTPDTSDDKEFHDRERGRAAGGQANGAESIETSKEKGGAPNHVPNSTNEDKSQPKSDDSQTQDETSHKETDVDHKESTPSKPSEKQEGSNVSDSKHSTSFGSNPEKSSKGEGAADTAKVKGTVTTDRPQV